MVRGSDPIPTRHLLYCAAVIEVALLLPYLARAAADQVALVLACYVISGGAFAWLLWRLRGWDGRVASGRAVLVVIVAAVVFRLTLLPMAPATSTDVYRYLWEGLVQARGGDPYTQSPMADELAPLAAEYADTHGLINHPTVAAIYPPTAQMIFLGNAVVFDGSLLGWKLILLMFEGLLVGGLVLILRGRGLSALNLVGVLWCPLLLVECYEGGHLDMIGVALMVAALAAWQRRRPVVTGVLLGLAINVKYLWPGLLLVLLVARAGRRWRRATVLVTALAVALAAWIPYRSALSAAGGTVRTFAESWTFNDVFFELLRSYLPGPRVLPMLVVAAVLVALALLLARRRGADPWPDVWLLSGTALLLGPVAYPWYFIWVVPAAALRPPAWLVAWLLSVPLLHLVDWHYAATGDWDPMAWLWYVVGVVPAVLLARAWWRRWQAREKHAMSNWHY